GRRGHGAAHGDARAGRRARDSREGGGDRGDRLARPLRPPGGGGQDDPVAGKVLVDVPVPGVGKVVVVLPSRQETPSRLPIPAGTGSAVHVAPPSRVTSTAPATWLRSTVVRAAAQQGWESVQEMDVAPETAAGRVP